MNIFDAFKRLARATPNSIRQPPARAGNGLPGVAKRVRIQISFRPLVMALAVAGAFSTLPAPTCGATYTVTTTASGGGGSLAQAINSANANPGTDTIAFNISGGGTVKTILVPVPLPTITDPVVIDGTTQPGYGTPTASSVPIVALAYNGGGLTFDGLRITAGSSTVRGLIIYGFVLGAGVRLENGGNNVIRHNWIGLDTSMTARRNTVGIVVVNSSGNTIGGANVGPSFPFPGNVISGNTTFPTAGGGRGIELIDASVNVIQGNIIGTDFSTQLARPNDVGIVIRGNSVDNLIGGGTDAVMNWISANAREGLLITGTGARLNRVVGNLIGHWPSGFNPLGNGGHGIMLTLGAEGNVIGGVAGERAANTVWYSGGDGVFIAGANNVVRSNFIAFNAASGVNVSGGPSSVGNSITNNSIFGNTCLPIDLWVGASCTVTTNDPGDTDTGPNNLQNFPVLTAVNPVVGGSMSINGALNSLAGRTYQIDVYRRPPSPGAGVGLFHVGRTMINPGVTTFSLIIPGNFPTDFFSATATDVTAGVPHDTSEFSPERLPTPPITLPTLTVNNVNMSEGSGGGLRNFNFVLSLSAASAQPVTVECSTQDGSAKAFCGDYVSRQNVSVTLLAGLLNTPFTVQVREDSDIETHETFFVNLSNPSGATLGAPRATGTIQNDDGAVPNANYRVVTTTAATGTGSLASAVTLANANSDLDVIAFDIAGAGPHVINQSPALPAIGFPLVIDATTQPGYVDRPLVELNGGSTPGLNNYGLRVTASDCVVRGLSVTRWSGVGLLLDGGANHVLEACFVGLGPAGVAAGNELGVWLENSSNNRLGGVEVWRRNVISANRAAGFRLERSSNNRFQGNLIGLDLTGAARNNGFYGIALEDTSQNNIIGNSGISISNRRSEANVIAFSGAAAGVAVFDAASTGNRISGNAIYKNSGLSPGLGIDLGNNGVTANDSCDGDAGPNNVQNYPEIAQITGSATGPSTTVSGTLNSAAGRSCVLDFYANSFRNSSGFGDGETYLGSMTTAPVPASCLANFSATLPVAVAHGQWITATATDNTTGDTSEFSRAVEVGPIIVPGPKGSVCFTTLVGRTYSVRCAPTPSGPWTVVATGIAGTGGVVCQLVVAPGAMAFYLVTSP